MGPSLYRIVRPLLFALDSERAHALTLSGLDWFARLGLLQAPAAAAPGDEREVMGLRFPNPVGLAAGLDKDGRHIDALARLGFGFIEVGTVTPRAQPGNARPRLLRLPEREALINRMGFNNGGLEAFLANVGRARFRGVLGLNIGKNADTPIERALDDYLACLRGVYPHASYITVNVSSPNTSQLRDLQADAALAGLLDALKNEQSRLADHHGRYVPLALKIAPDLDAGEIDTIARNLVRYRIDAVIATNTTVARDGLDRIPLANQAGGLSGAPLLERANRVTRRLADALDGAVPIIGAGGIVRGADAAAKVRAGATLVQLYTGLIYRGPALIGECARALRAAPH